MDTAITLHDLLRVILYLAGAGALIYLALVLKKLLKVLGSVEELIEGNCSIINDTIKKVPALTDNAVGISENVNSITKDTKEIVNTAKPDVEKITRSAGNVAETIDDISRSVDETTLKLKTTAANLSDTISDTANTISVNANNVIDYFYIIKEVISTVKEIFLSKK